jgi:glycerate kinase
MRILVAPDSFKGSISAVDAAEAIRSGLRNIDGQIQIDVCPIADGGEGTLDALVAATDGQAASIEVCGPLGDPLEARWGLLGDGQTAVVEMAEAAGLTLLEKTQRDPDKTTTYGVGQLIGAALDQGIGRLIVAIGGSATNDGGCGALQALGVHFHGGVQPMTGGALASVVSIDSTKLDGRISSVDVVVACDVTNPLTGPSGATAVYGPQKGASAQQVETLDQGLAHLASLIESTDSTAPGMGAAGGLGFGLVAFCGARLVRGIELVLDAVGFADRVRGCDLVITGEGMLDGQSLAGKATVGVAQAARAQGVDTIALVGGLGADVAGGEVGGFRTVRAICDGSVSVEAAMADAAGYLAQLAQGVVRDEFF